MLASCEPSEPVPVLPSHPRPSPSQRTHSPKMSKRPAEEDPQDASTSRRQKRDSPDQSPPLTLKALISNREAASLIGKEGGTIAAIRTSTTARVSVSEHVKGTIERVVSVSGTPGVIADAYPQATSIKDEVNPVDQTVKPFTLRLVIPHAHLGAIIGKQGARIREIMSATGAHIQASEFNLPLSSERCVVVRGPAEAIRLAIQQITETMQVGLASSHVAMTVAYQPVTLGGIYGHPESFRRIEPNDTMMTPSNPYGIPPSTFAAPPQADAQAGTASATATSKGVSKSKEKVTQQIYIPNDMVGAIIGKQGSKINEIRNLSGSHVKVNEPDPARVTERLITIEGTAEQNQLALYMLYQRLESEKRRG
ncbi:hypothetical protein BCR37DRAFT_402160 [Protomyces lactucae-debilis]|uniref:K Homology domain-containing protein n=1 Tax=Protomyces lactucae-debilis TaxID=2754530 RepID=A0A1Y2FNP4_PROLT|nr:uncharacterized protein BCR37DRAFT_402160 [Protomyces lactucae-debilis]ORY84836.1 hypothetical protein BCR37DRAFT_402160 [Protomyces lactucae-debilis]